MKKNMQLTLAHPSKSTIESIIEFINELIDSLKIEKKPKAQVVVKKVDRGSLSRIEACITLRKNRISSEKLISDFLKKFEALPEKQQADIEMHFYNAIKKLESLVERSNEDLKKHKFSLSCRFVNREIHLTLNTFKSSQKIMSDFLYPDNSKQILSNPAEYQKLVDFWGELAD